MEEEMDKAFVRPVLVRSVRSVVDSMSPLTATTKDELADANDPDSGR
jgi:hypothetical protein